MNLKLLETHNNIIYLNKFFKSESGLNLLNAIKRVNNIISDNQYDKKLEPNTKLFETKEELKLYTEAKKHNIENESDYKGLMERLLFLVGPIENFFDKVQIHHQNKILRKNRLLLLLFVNIRVNKSISFLNLIKRN